MAVMTGLLALLTRGESAEDLLAGGQPSDHVEHSLIGQGFRGHIDGTQKERRATGQLRCRIPGELDQCSTFGAWSVVLPAQWRSRAEPRLIDNHQMRGDERVEIIREPGGVFKVQQRDGATRERFLLRFRGGWPGASTSCARS